MSSPHPAYPVDGFSVPEAPPVYALAEPFQRFLARLIDNVVLVAGFFALAVPIIMVIIARTRTARDEQQVGPYGEVDLPTDVELLWISIPVLILLVAVGYETFCLAKWGATVGKRAMKLRVVRADGGTVGWGRALGRVLTHLVFNVIPCVGYLDPLWLLWDQPNRQTLHDKLVRTIVVRTDDPAVAQYAELSAN